MTWGYFQCWSLESLTEGVWSRCPVPVQADTEVSQLHLTQSWIQVLKVRVMSYHLTGVGTIVTFSLEKHLTGINTERGVYLQNVRCMKRCN